MRAVQVSRRNGPLELVERDIPTPGRNAVRVKVEACGVCHSDSGVVDGLFPFVEYPRVLGHEVAGVIDALGPGVTGWRVGQRVGMGWNGGYDGTCEHCRRGDFFACDSNAITGVTLDGGYAEYTIAAPSALVRIPDALSATDAGPLLCAGTTSYNAIRSFGLRGGDLVAVHGIGGVGHLAVQFAAKMGFHTVAIGRGADKEELARKLGAAAYLDSTAVDPAKELAKRCGARAIFDTIPSGKAMSEMVAGLAVNGKLVVIGGASDPITVLPAALIFGRQSIAGWASGTSIDSEDNLAFSVQTGVRPMNEIFPLERAAEAYERMLSGKVRFRAVLQVAQ
jgi:D-arabinose 1-dehydrogenase-like Zn-dependent alcohol dehydrogenase